MLVVESGVGPTRARRAFDWLTSHPQPPTALISAGFAGGLSPELAAGDVIHPSEVVTGDGSVWPVTFGPVSPGRLLTMPRLIADPHEKLRLGREHSALAVDMESATLARLCHERGVRFGCVRAVSDAAGDRLSPRLVGLLAGGQVRPLRLGAAVVTEPRLVGALLRLARATRGAARDLARALREALPTQPGPAYFDPARSAN